MVFAKGILDLNRIPRLATFTTIRGTTMNKFIDAPPQIERTPLTTVAAPKAKTKKKKFRQDSLVNKRCRHSEADRELCGCPFYYYVTHEKKKFRDKILGASTWDEARTKYALIAARIRNGQPAVEPELPANTQTVKDAVEEWQRTDERRKDSTKAMYRNLWSKHLTPVIGSQAVTAPTIDALERLMADVREKNPKLSFSTRRRVAIALQAFFSWAERRRKRQDNPAKGLAASMKDQTIASDAEVIDPKRDRAKYFDADEARHLQVTVRNKFPQWDLFIKTAFETGMRMGELAALRYSDINVRSSYITVRWNWVHGKFVSPKNGKPRIINVSAELATLFRVRRMWRRDRTCDLVFPVQEGKPAENGVPIDVRYFRRSIWSAMMEAAGFEARTPKAMRHTTTTLHLMAGKPIAWVAAQAGRSISETERTYFHFLPTEARSGAEDLAALLRPKTHVSPRRELRAKMRRSTATKLERVAR